MSVVLYHHKKRAELKIKWISNFTSFDSKQIPNQIRIIADTYFPLHSGYSVGNEKRLMQGLQDWPLTEKGREQARRAGYTLSDVKFTQAYSSPASRALETCRLILEHNLHLLQGQGIEIKENGLLQERTMGVLDGLPWSEFKVKAAEAGFHGEEMWSFVPEKGESPDDVKRRGADFLSVSELTKGSKGVLSV